MSDLRTVRKKLNLTIEDLANLSGSRFAIISNVETGKNLPRARNMRRNESVLGWKID